MGDLGLYIHIPFCQQKCRYCDFLSFTGCNAETKESYIKALMSEVCYQAEKYNDKVVDSIFIGGGTPSIVEPQLLFDLLDLIRRKFHVSASAEITVEANPGTLSKDKLRIYKDAGINRLSLGVQSFDDEDLRILGRIHTGDEAKAAFSIARDTGFDNINLDLMFAFPKHNQKKWQYNLEQIGELSPEHVSFYSLQIEEGTPFYQDLKNGSLAQLSEEEDRKLYHMGIDRLKDLGYIHYEISNGAKPGFMCRHNLKYWSFQEYLGLGLGAHSFTDGKRYANTDNLKEYAAFPGKRLAFEVKNTAKDDIFEYVFTALRKTSGISFSDFEMTFGVDFWRYYDDIKEKILQYQREGKVILTKAGLALTLDGMDISNKIMSEFSLD